MFCPIDDDVGSDFSFNDRCNIDDLFFVSYVLSNWSDTEDRADLLTRHLRFVLSQST